MAGELAEAFEQHLRSLSDTEWDALAARVRTPQPSPAPPAAPLPNERTDSKPDKGEATNFGRAEAERRYPKSRKPVS